MKNQFFFGCQLYLNKGEKEIEHQNKQYKRSPKLSTAAIACLQVPDMPAKVAVKTTHFSSTISRANTRQMHLSYKEKTLHFVLIVFHNLFIWAWNSASGLSDLSVSRLEQLEWAEHRLGCRKGWRVDGWTNKDTETLYLLIPEFWLAVKILYSNTREHWFWGTSISSL